MSWIYTLVFSGLLFSSNAGTARYQELSHFDQAPNVTVTKSDETDRFEQTYPLSANGRVSVSNVNGSIVAEAWDRNEVKLIATKTADSKEKLADIEIKIESKLDSFSVETNYDNWKQKSGNRWKNGGKLQVDYQLMIPRAAVLNEVETVNGSVTISNFTNFTKVSAVNGNVTASNLRGTADLSTVNGEVDADFNNLDAASKISIGTVNGRAKLTIPSDANATIRVDSLNGVITNDFGLPVRKGKYVGRDLYGKLGSGDVRIKLDSVNGDLKILRQNDGKTPGPVTNLLPQKEKDDEDWDKDDEDVPNIRSVKIDKEIAKALKESQKASISAMKQARKEIGKIQPEIAKVTADSLKQAAEVLRSAPVQNAIKDGLKQQKAILAKISDISFFPPVPRVEIKSNSFPVKGIPQVNIQSHGCAIKVTGWNKSEVKYAVTQLSSSHDRTPLDIKESHDDASMTLKIENNDDLERTRIEIFVPKKSNLKINTDSEIRLDGVSGEIDLTGEDGAINVRDADGKLTVATNDGRIRVIGFRGEIQTRANDGMTNLEGDFTMLTASAASGLITVTMPDDSTAIFKTAAETDIDGLSQIRVIKNEKYQPGDGETLFNITTAGRVTLRSTGSIKTPL